jgi:Lipocalin-like domain
MRFGNLILRIVATAIISTPVLAPTALADSGSSAPTSAVERLVGGWSLVSRFTNTLDGKTLSDPGLSATPKGVLIYDRFGHVAAQLSRPGRTVAMLGEECREAENVKGTNDTAQTILGYDAYFGTYTIDVAAGVVTHHLESALFPGDIGKDIKRQFSISGNTLTITFHTTLRDGTPVVRTLVWTRMK